MTMFEGKAIVLAALLKQDKPFKAARIYQMTDLSRSLVRYHLDNFVKEGGLEKHGMYYAIADRDILIDIITSVSEGPSIQMAEKALLLGKDAAHINNAIRTSAALRTLGIPYSDEIKKHIVSEIDWAIKQLKNARKYVNEKSMTEKRAAKVLRELEVVPEELYNASIFGLQEIVGKEEFKKIYAEHIEGGPPVAKPTVSTKRQYCILAVANISNGYLVEGKCPWKEPHTCKIVED